MYIVEYSKTRRICYIIFNIIWIVSLLVLGIFSFCDENGVLAGITCFFVSGISCFFLPVNMRKKIIVNRRVFIYNNGYKAKRYNFSDVGLVCYKKESRETVLPSNPRLTISGFPNTFIILKDKNGKKIVKFWDGLEYAGRFVKDLKDSGIKVGK